MNNYFSTHFAGRKLKAAVSLFLGAALFLACASPAAAQKKKKTDTPPATDNMPSLPMNDEQQIDYTISEMLGAWQLGDVDKAAQGLRRRCLHRQRKLGAASFHLGKLSPHLSSAAQPHATGAHGQD